jgi:hypothetical protein
VSVAVGKAIVQTTKPLVFCKRVRKGLKRKDERPKKSGNRDKEGARI